MTKEAPKLTPEDVRAIEGIIGREKDAQIGIRRDKLVIWETSSKKKYEAAVAAR